MIIQKHDRFTLICDDCYREVDKDSFEECIVHAKKTGWEIENDNGNWYNYCADCQEEEF